MGECMNMFELPYSISEDVKRTSHEFGKILVEFLECLSVLDLIKFDEISGY